MTALTESFLSTSIHNVFSWPILTFLRFSRIGKPILDRRLKQRLAWGESEARGVESNGRSASTSTHSYRKNPSAHWCAWTNGAASHPGKRDHGYPNLLRRGSASRRGGTVTICSQR